MSLKVLNSLTGKKEPLPDGHGVLKFYICGPTVYDMSHLGHAKVYVTFDIICRILQNYYNKPVKYVMNITDCDDKIIDRAFTTHLVDLFKAQYRSSDSDRKIFLQALEFCDASVSDESREIVELLSTDGKSNDKLFEISEKYLAKYLPTISPYKDVKYNNEIFEKYAAKYETEFHKDMSALDVLARVTEYIPEMIAYIKVIMDIAELILVVYTLIHGNLYRGVIHMANFAVQLLMQNYQ